MANRSVVWAALWVGMVTAAIFAAWPATALGQSQTLDDPFTLTDAELQMAAPAESVVLSTTTYAPVETTTPSRPANWEWTFPGYIGNLGGYVGAWSGVQSDNMHFGVFYRHFENTDGPLYFGFEVSPFTFGAIYDDYGYPALYSWSSRFMLSLRIYTDMVMPELYFEIGAGPQYMRFRTSDNFARIYENGFQRDWFGRWRLAGRLAVGLEFDFVGLEFGWVGMFPGFEFQYTPYYPTHPVVNADIRGSFYFSLHFRFDD